MMTSKVDELREELARAHQAVCDAMKRKTKVLDTLADAVVEERWRRELPASVTSFSQWPSRGLSSGGIEVTFSNGTKFTLSGYSSYAPGLGNCDVDDRRYRISNEYKILDKQNRKRDREKVEEIEKDLDIVVQRTRHDYTTFVKSAVKTDLEKELK